MKFPKSLTKQPSLEIIDAEALKADKSGVRKPKVAILLKTGAEQPKDE